MPACAMSGRPAYRMIDSWICSQLEKRIDELRNSQDALHIICRNDVIADICDVGPTDTFDPFSDLANLLSTAK